MEGHALKGFNVKEREERSGTEIKILKTLVTGMEKEYRRNRRRK
jgi:hypothetical protein